MKIRTLHLLALFTFIFAFVLAAPKRAAADDDDPPTRVARLSFTSGQVSFNPSGTDDWVSSEVNRPITTGDKLWTDHGALAELHIGSAAIRLSGETGFSFLNLDDRVTQIRVTEGTIGLSVRRMADDESIEIDTPNLAFSILRPGRYRISVNEEGDTTLINISDGEGEITGGGSAYTVHPEEQGIFSGTDSLNADIEPLPDEDEFDYWCNRRDLREDHAVARRYVSDDVVGYEDLDEYGGWRNVPEYGTIWFPRVTIVGWAPYRFGHWAWVSPWGWTWVDDAPWGFAPFHYGRWVFVSGSWGWVPAPPRVVGVAYVRPVYAPALVAWVGGPHFAVGVAFGRGAAVGVNIGWFPLGPREVFVPSYPVSRTYVNRVNVSNTTVNETVVNNYYNTTVVNKTVIVNNNVRYVNQGVPGAVTATSHESFTSARPVARNLVVVNQREIATAPVAVSAPAVVPPKQAVLGGGASTNVHPPMIVQNRAVVVKTAPPPPPPPFQQRQAAIQANQGRPLSAAQVRQIQPPQARAAVAPVRMAPVATPATPRINNAQSGGNRSNRPVPVNTTQPPSAAPNQGNPATQGGQANQNKPANPPAPMNNTRPPNAPPNQVNPAAQGTQVNQDRPPVQGTNADRPPAARPSTAVDPRAEQKHQQEVQQLQQKQDQENRQLQLKQQQDARELQQKNAEVERQRQLQQQREQQLQQQQQQEAQKLQQKNAEAERQRQLQQQRQPQPQQPAQNQNQDKPAVKQKPEAERAKSAPPAKAKPAEKEKEKDKDKEKPQR